MLEIPCYFTIAIIFSNIKELSVILESLVHVSQVVAEIDELHDSIVNWMHEVKVSFDFSS